MEEYVKIVTILLREYREVAERIVERADHNPYVRVADRERLALLNSEVDRIEQTIRASLPEK